jgi:hypothetical protein
MYCARGLTWEKVDKDSVDIDKVIFCRIKKQIEKLNKPRNPIYLYKINNMKRLSTGMKKKIKCIETGEIWPSIGEAAEAVKASRNWFGEQIKKNEKYKGKTYVLADTPTCNQI